MLYCNKESTTMTYQYTEDLTVYVLVRTDLPSLSPAKAMAQTHHAATQMMSKHSNHPFVKGYIEYGIKQGADHFNTTLIMAATLPQLIDIHSNMLTLDLCCFDIVTDPTYPFVVDSEISNLLIETDTMKKVKVLDNGDVLWTRNEVTCAWFLIDRNYEAVKSFFKDLSLLRI